LDNAVIFTVSIPRLKYHEIFFRILADYRLRHLVNNVAIHMNPFFLIVFHQIYKLNFITDFINPGTLFLLVDML